MIRYLVGTILGVLAVLSVWSSQTTSLSYSIAMTTSTPMPSPNNTTTFTPTSHSLWQVYSYTHTAPPIFTFSLEYPSYRQATVFTDAKFTKPSELAWVTFLSPITITADKPIGLSFFALPYKYRSQYDPRYAYPNFPQYPMFGEVLWFEVIQVDGVDSLLYVGGDYSGCCGTDPSLMYSLNLISYNRDIEAHIEASIGFSPDDWAMVKQRGFTETVRQRFPSFIHMVKSLHVVPDSHLVKPTPIPEPIPQPITVTTWLTESIGAMAVVEYPAEWQILDYDMGEGTHQTLFTLPIDGGVTVIPSNYVIHYGYRVIRPDQPMTKQDFQSDDSKWEEWLPIAGVDGAIMQVRREEGLLKLIGTVYRNPNSSQPDAPVGVAIDFSTVLDTESVTMARTQGLTQTIATRFQVFRHMVETVKFLNH